VLEFTSIFHFHWNGVIDSNICLPALDYLRTLAIKPTITSNGHSVAVLEDDDVRAFHHIEFSLDYPNQTEKTCRYQQKSRS
jgi:hypothetical protein